MPTVAEKMTPQIVPGPSFTFKVPEGSRQLPGDPKSFKMQLPNAMAELEANQIGGLGLKMVHELIQRCVVEIDGKPVDQAMPWFDATGPKVRELMIAALNHITRPQDKDRSDFLASMKTDA